jgi:hypothetical protein
MQPFRFLLTCLFAACSATNYHASSTSGPLVGNFSSDQKISARGAGEEPGDSNLRDTLTHYESLLKAVLLSNSGQHPYVRMICLPSFGEEWVVAIEKPREGSSKVLYVRAKRPIRMDPRPDEIETDTAIAQMFKATASKIRQAWIVMLSNPRTMEPRDMGNDGVRYRFATFVRDHGVLTDETWSPEPKYPSGLLVELGKTLRDFTLAEAKDRIEFETSLGQKVEYLLSQIPVLEWQKRLFYDDE